MIIAKSSARVFFYLVLFFFVWVDTLSYLILQQPVIFCSLCWYILALRGKPRPLRIIYGLFLLSFLSLLVYGKFGLNLIYLIPATVIGIQIPYLLYDSLVPYLLLLTLCLASQVYGIEWYLLQFPCRFSQLALVVAVNLAISIAIVNIPMLKNILTRSGN